MPYDLPVREDDDLIRNRKDTLLMGDDHDRLSFFAQCLKYADQAVETPQVDACFRLVKDRKLGFPCKRRSNFNPFDLSAG